METKIQNRKPEDFLMLFIAKTENKTYQIEVHENINEWQVSLTDCQTKNKETYKIAKKDYQQFGEVLSFLFKNRSYLIDIIAKGDQYTAFTKGSHKNIQLMNEEKMLYNKLTGGGAGEAVDIKSGMPGKVVTVRVKPGQTVKEGDLLLIIEAMKMENEIRAVKTGKIKKVYVNEGQNVETNTKLLSFIS